MLVVRHPGAEADQIEDGEAEFAGFWVETRAATDHLEAIAD
jgi:hypothetical protein